MRTQKIAYYKKCIFSKSDLARVTKFFGYIEDIESKFCCEFRADRMNISGKILISLSKFADFFFTLSANGDGAQFH